MIKKKVPYTLLTATALATLLSSAAFAAKGDFYYGDASNLTRVQKSEIKDRKDELKDNKDNLYYQIDDTNIVEYSKYITKIVTGWATGSIGDAVVAANADATIRASADIVQRAAQVDAGEETGITVSSVSAITTTDVTVVLADGFDATAAADVKSYSIAINGAAAVNPTAVTIDATAKTAKLSISLTGQEGSLTVNGVAATVPTGAEFAFDFKAPSIESVTNINGNQLVVTFSEKVTNAQAPSNYMLKNTVTGAQTTLDTATSGGNTGSSIVVNSDGKSATITLSSDQTNDLGVSGLNTLDAVQYRLFAVASNNITDYATTPNKLAGNSYITFTGAIASDSTAPVLQSASFNTGTKVLTLNYNEVATIADMTKITLSDGTTSVQLAGTETKTQDNNSQIEITLSNSDTLAKINAMTGTNWTVSIGADAFKDASNNLTLAVPETTCTTVVSPLVQSASYDEASEELTVKFTKPVKVSSFTDFSQITVTAASVTTGTVTGGIAIKAGTPAVTDTIVFTLNDVAALEMNNNRANAATAGAYKVKFADNSIKDANDVPLATGSGAEVNCAYIKDEVAPELATASFDSGTKEITLNFSERVTGTPDGAKFSIYYDNNGTKTVLDTDDDTSSLKDGAANVDTSATPATLTLSDDGKGAKAILTTAMANKVVALKDKALYVKVLTSNGLTDLGDNAVKNWTSSTYEVMAPLTYVDAAKATASVSYLSGNKIAITFTKPMLKSAVETTTNYSIVQNGNPTNIRTVTNAALSSDGKQVVLTLDSALTSGVNFTLTMSNIKDSLNYDIAAGEETKTLSLATTQPDIVSTTYVDNGDNVQSAGDSVKIKFDQPIQLASGATIAKADFVAGTDLGTSEPTFTINGDTLIMTFTSTPSLDFTSNANAGEAVIATGDSVLSKIKNLGADKVAKVGIAANGYAAAVDTVSPVVSTVAYTDVNNNAIVDADDTLVVKFDKNVVYTDGTHSGTDLVAGDFIGTTDGAAADADWNLGSATFAQTANDTITITLANDSNLNKTASTKSFDSTVKVGLKNGTLTGSLTNTWGIAATGGSNEATACAAAKAETLANTVNTQPKLTNVSVQMKDATHADYFILEFNNPVALNGATATTSNDAFTALLHSWVGSTATVVATDGLGADDTSVTYMADADGNPIYTKIKIALVATNTVYADENSTLTLPASSDLFSGILTDINGRTPVRSNSTLPINIIPPQ